MSWSGFYVGGHAGLANARTQGDPDLGFGPPNLFSTDFDMSGALYGGQVGYNWQTGSTVFGIEGSLSGSSMQGNTTCAVLLECKRDLDWLATVAGKVGYAWGGSLLYAMGGVAWGDVGTECQPCGGFSSERRRYPRGLGGGLRFRARDLELRLVEGRIRPRRSWKIRSRSCGDGRLEVLSHRLGRS